MLARKIRNYLTKHKISFDELSARSGVTASTIANVCSGYCMIDAVVYYKICRALGVDLELFFK